MADMKARTVEVGDILTATYEGEEYQLKVIDHPTKEGRVAFSLIAGSWPAHPKGVVEPGIFSTLSGAAESITFPKMRNGWTFWHAEGEADEAPKAEKPKRVRAKKAAAVSVAADEDEEEVEE